MIVFLFVMKGSASSEVSWTDQSSPLSYGNFNDVYVTDLDKNGIKDIIAASSEIWGVSQAEGIPVWLGTAMNDGTFGWALSEDNFPSGRSASMPLVDEYNVGNGCMMRVTIGNPFTEISDWEAICSEPAHIETVISHGSGNCTIDPEAEGTFVHEMWCRDMDAWTCRYNQSQGAWIISSQYHGTLNSRAHTDEFYTSDLDIIGFTIESEDDPPENNDQITFITRTSEFLILNAHETEVDTDPSPGITAWPHANTGGPWMDWRPILGSWILAGTDNFETGDKFTFHIPEGPPTNDIYNQVLSVDIDLDGDMDLIGAGEGGIKVFMQMGARVGPVMFLPEGERIKNQSEREYEVEITIANHSSITTEYWVFTFDSEDWTWDIESELFGENTRPVYEQGTWTGKTDYGQFTYEIESSGVPFDGDRLIFSTYHLSWSDAQIVDSQESYAGLTASDFNNDGMIDIAASPESGGIEVFLNEAPYGWQRMEKIPSSDAVAALDSADMNNDGKTDIISAGFTGGISLWPGDGTGGFGPDQGPADDNVYDSVDTGDINKDGIADITAVSADNGIYVWYRDSEGEWFQVARSSPPSADRDNVGTGTMSRITTNSATTLTEGWMAECIEEQKDGGFFQITGTRSGVMDKLAEVDELYISDGGELQFMIFDGAIDFAVDDRFTFTTSKGPVSNHRFSNAVLADLNQDSNPDIFSASADGLGIRIWKGNGGYGWLSETTPKDSSNYSDCEAVDLNFDGNPDVVAASSSYAGIQVWLSNNADKYSFQGWTAKPAASGQFARNAIADIDNDGIQDIVAANIEPDGEGIYIWKGNGLGEWENVNGPTEVPHYYSTDTGDLNHDGLEDVIAGHFESGISVWLNTMEGGWGLDVGPAVTGSYWGVKLVDINRDGNLDILGAKDFDYETGGVVFYLGTGDGTFGSPIPLPGAVYNFWDADAGDFDLDGFIDIAAAKYSGDGGTFVWWGGKDGMRTQFYNPAVIFSPGGHDHIYGIVVEDFNYDGFDDFAIGQDANGISYFLSAWNKNGNVTFFSGFVGGFNQIRSIDAGDIDLDCDLDIVAATKGGGVQSYRNTVYYPGGGISWSPLSHPTTTGNYIGVSLADMTQDGLLDIVASSEGSGASGVNAWLNARNFDMITVNWHTPAHNENFDLQADKEIVVNFDQALDPSTVTLKTIILEQWDESASQFVPVPYSLYINDDHYTISIVPGPSLSIWNTIRVKLIGGIYGIKNTDGNPFDGNYNGEMDPYPEDNYIFTFETVDYTPPSVCSGLIAASSHQSAHLRWSPNNEQDLEGYWVCYDDEARGQELRETEIYYTKEEVGYPPNIFVHGLELDKEYYFSVVPQDIWGNYPAYCTDASAVPAQLAPVIWMAGTNDTYLTSAAGGLINITAFASSGAAPMTDVKLFVEGLDTGIILQDDGASGDFSAGDGIFGIEIPATGGLPSGAFPFEIVAFNELENHYSYAWPYIAVTANDPGYDQNSSSRSNTKNRLLTQHFNSEPQLPSWQTYHAPTAGTSTESPLIRMAGFMGRVLSFERNSTMKLLAFADDPQGYSSLSKVELYAYGQPTGVMLSDNGDTEDFGPGDGIFGFTAEIPAGALEPGYYDFLEIRAGDIDGNYSNLWPYLNIYGN